MRSRAIIVVLFAASIAYVVGTAGCAQPRPPQTQNPEMIAHPATERVGHTRPAPGVEVWDIEKPVVTQRRTEYRGITFQPGDTVTISAQGCVQIGGRGKTWKRYVDPRGPHSEKLYHALVEIPGVTDGLVRLEDVIDTPKRIAETETTGRTIAGKPMDSIYLTLGYEDDFWPDNGYYDRDEGIDGQCMFDQDAAVRVKVVHAAPQGPSTDIPIAHSTPEARSVFRAAPKPNHSASTDFSPR